MSKDDIAARLVEARKAAGFDSARQAAQALGISPDSYSQHENGTRGFKLPSAQRYARRYRVSVQWLLTGKGERDAAPVVPSVVELESMVRSSVEEAVTVGTKVVDLPSVIAPILRSRLEEYQEAKRA